MAFSPKRALSTGAKTYATTSALGPKVSIPITAAAAVFDGFMGDKKEFDPTPFYEGHKNFAKETMKSARKMSRELGAQQGARMASRGTNESAAGDFIIGQNKANIYRQAQSHIDQNLRDLEHRLAIAQANRENAVDAKEQAQWDTVVNDSLALLNDSIQNADDPDGNAARQEWFNNLLVKYGFKEAPSKPKMSTAMDTGMSRMALPNIHGDVDVGIDSMPTYQNWKDRVFEQQKVQLEQEYGSEMIDYITQHIPLNELIDVLSY